MKSKLPICHKAVQEVIIRHVENDGENAPAANSRFKGEAVRVR